MKKNEISISIFIYHILGSDGFLVFAENKKNADIAMRQYLQKRNYKSWVKAGFDKEIKIRRGLVLKYD